MHMFRYDNNENNRDKSKVNRHSRVAGELNKTHRWCGNMPVVLLMHERRETERDLHRCSDDDRPWQPIITGARMLQARCVISVRRSLLSFSASTGFRISSVSIIALDKRVPPFS